MLNKKWILIALALLVMALLIFAKRNVTVDKSIKQKGVCWVGTRDSITIEQMLPLKEHGITWISLTPFAFQSSFNDTTLRFHHKEDKKGWWGESFNGIRQTTRMAKRLNLKVTLKPHIWLRQGWPGEIEMDTEQKWKTWFQKYENYILGFAQLAEEEKIEILCIGTELKKTIHRKEWRNLISSIRKIYKGKITYAANFDEYQQVPFWHQLDYIGIQAYFPLCNNPSCSQEEIKLKWKTINAELQSFYHRKNKPILFTEIGYRSANDAAVKPWEWPERNQNNNFSEEAQAQAYEAFFSTTWNEKWLSGVYFWKWYPRLSERLPKTDFTPQQKQASTVLKKYFNLESNDKGY